MRLFPQAVRLRAGWQMSGERMRLTRKQEVEFCAWFLVAAVVLCVVIA